MSMTWIRQHYNVPAKRGVRVEIDGKRGVITGTSGPHLRVRLDGDKHAVPAHPTWHMTYLTEGDQQP